MKNKTEFIRVEKTNNFSIIHNGFLRRKDLSWKSKGILAYILSLPDDWNINLSEVMRHATEGERAFRSGWKELTDAGYVKRYPVKNKDTNKITHWETVVKENVDITTTEPDSCFVHVGNVDVQNVHVQNDKLLSTNNTKDLIKQSTNNTKVKNIKQDFDELWKKYPNKQGKQKAFKAYSKAINEGVTKDVVSKGLENFIKYCEENSWYTPAHGGTWFFNKRWEDEYSASKVQVFHNSNSNDEPDEITPEQQKAYVEYQRGLSSG